MNTTDNPIWKSCPRTMLPCRLQLGRRLALPQGCFAGIPLSKPSSHCWIRLFPFGEDTPACPAPSRSGRCARSSHRRGECLCHSSSLHHPAYECWKCVSHCHLKTTIPNLRRLSVIANNRIQSPPRRQLIRFLADEVEVVGELVRGEAIARCADEFQ